ncbi:MAG: imidazole glycerol phosphate synthase subunit HisF [Alphaproteobacteria bacterium]|nr:imidazole glycerol phosphate synthase subunit HisF [Alphaproteobacteria bacterium]
MLTRRIIPCLDVKDGVVVKGIGFRDHRVVGDITERAALYSAQGADELVFYDITASAEGRTVDYGWVERVARQIDIPFCVAGGIRSLAAAEKILGRGADKVSINSPALENPALIGELALRFGVQCVVVGIDSRQEEGGYRVYQYTGSAEKTRDTARETAAWAHEAAERGAGEIVLNCMRADGRKDGYDIPHLRAVRAAVNIPLVASGGAGRLEHFADAFTQADADAALAASVFHDNLFTIGEVKGHLRREGIAVRL